MWAYAARSVAYIFGDAVGDPVADGIAGALRTQRELSRTMIRDLFHRNISSERIAGALQLLAKLGRAQPFERQSDGPGRPTEWWRWIAS